MTFGKLIQIISFTYLKVGRCSSTQAYRALRWRTHPAEAIAPLGSVIY
ncbi:hypothetical protein [Nostoc sp.]